ncbi:MAG: AAA family ATPase [Promethearchaeota archaeon]
MKNIIDEYLDFEVFKTYGLNPKQKILFCGPPGTGKTLSTKILSSILNLPLIYIRFDAIVSSYLGETANNLRKIFNFIDKGEWVVLFDEFDIIGKKRDDPHEHGEIKRIVNNFIQMLDNYMGKSILIAATNHHHLLDIAIWRRFDEIVYFKIPDEKLRILIFEKYTKVFNKNEDINFNELAKETKEFSPADIAQTCYEAIKKAILKNSKEINNNDLLLAIRNQRRKKSIIIS